MFQYPNYSLEERETLMKSQVNSEQRQFLENELKRGKRTIFDNIMRSEKVTAIKSTDDIPLELEELDVVDWMITDFMDFGEGRRDGQCACGLSLRYQFTVEHQKTGKKIQYGKYHLSTFLNLDVRDINGVIKELDRFDYELDELLWKIENVEYGYEEFEKIPDKTVVSKGITKHIEMNVPLLDRQVGRLRKHYREQMQNILNEKLKMQFEASSESSQMENEPLELHYEDKKKIEEQIKSLLKNEQQPIKMKENDFHKRKYHEKKEKQAKGIEATKELISYGANFDEIAFSLVSNGINSAVEISWIMINEFGMDKRISISEMDRPYIYFDVLVALMKKVDSGLLYMDESSDIDDCIFYKNPNPVEVNENIKNHDIQQELSLFL